GEREDRDSERKAKQRDVHTQERRPVQLQRGRDQEQRENRPLGLCTPDEPRETAENRLEQDEDQDSHRLAPYRNRRIEILELDTDGSRVTLARLARTGQRVEPHIRHSVIEGDGSQL